VRKIYLVGMPEDEKSRRDRRITPTAGVFAPSSSADSSTPIISSASNQKIDIFPSPPSSHNGDRATPNVGTGLVPVRLMGVNVFHIRRQSLTGDSLLAAKKKSPQGLNYGDARTLLEICTFAHRIVPVCRVFGDVDVPGEELTPGRLSISARAEEVVVRKDVSERTETVRDTVRREQVEVEKEGGSRTDKR